ncbi:conserved protein of unknown function [Acetoanaerobium sticklandii]|uniref:Uncharacterized protein n=1 Tax=Acetoanaerobium sticklandii (strain ATCC 12662 / DSM 519 / JCM 1433 / CCUG 9281 / NCIMB 10654 / HF) TaxID=499177 RepID=E3PWP8_ACESD|nr:hypothetical protein [Acetoanaerobium sticklandii]CBH20863.1 conserved protein of unknown function [Acetoanaerobium sticklandii]
MIFSKNAIFPYPVLKNELDDYTENIFNLEVDLKDNTNEFIFEITYEIGSDYIKNLIDTKKAALFLVIRAKDNKFFRVENNSKVSIPKNRISLDNRTSIQLIIRAEEQIDFQDNNDLTDFYTGIKTKISIDKHCLLGLSNVVIFDGSMRKPFDIFEKRISSDLNSDIKIEVGSETIIIEYKHEDYQFVTSPNSSILNYPYIYMGMQKALMNMITEKSEDGESLDFTDMEMPEEPLYAKLYNLLKSKGIDGVDIKNIDEVIYKSSDRILEKFSNVIKGLNENGN